MGYQVTRKDPAVTSIPVHLPESRSHHQYHRRAGPGSTVSLLDRYFHRPIGAFQLREQPQDFSELTYTQYYSLFRLQKFDTRNEGRSGYFPEQSHDGPAQHVILRSSGRRHLSRIENVRPSEGERFYLRTLLQHRPALSFEDLRTIDGTEYNTFQEAATALGLFADQNEGIYALKEAIETLRTPRQLRVLFVHLLVNDCLPTPIAVWDELQENFAYDFTLRHGNSVELGINYALEEMQSYLEEYGKSLADYGLPVPEMHSREVEHELLLWSSNRDELEIRADNSIQMLTDEQRLIVDDVLHAVTTGAPLTIFIDGKAGRGKTFLVNVICDKVRSMGRIVLPTATSAFAAQLYPGGRTTHSAFKACLMKLSFTMHISNIPSGSGQRKERVAGISNQTQRSPR